MTIYFYSPHEFYGEFSNFAPYGIEVDGAYFPTVEHYFQAQKFIGTEQSDRVWRARSPKEAARLGRDRSVPIRADWEDVKRDIMHAGVLAKFRRHEVIRDLLFATGDEDIVENSPGDRVWGCGPDGSGENALGQILVRVRAELRDAT